MPAREQPPGDRAVLAASVGSAALAAPALGAVGLLALFVASSVRQSTGSDLLLYAAIVAAVAVIVGAGLALLWGYWRIRFGEMAPARQPRFWAWSAVYNGVVSLVAIWSVLAQARWTPVETVLPLALLTWAGWMVWIGLRRSVFAPSP